MAKIPFDIKYRPQIESGEYKVENRKGELVRVVCYDAKISALHSGNQKPILSLQKEAFGEDEIVCHHFQDGMVYRGEEDARDLFIITPEEEMTGFEEGLNTFLFDFVHTTVEEDPTEYIKKTSGVLLSLAREQFIKDGYVIEKKTFHDTVENISDRQLTEMRIEYSLHCKVEDGTRHAVMEWPEFQKLAQKFIDMGKAEVLKDLPRWKKCDFPMGSVNPFPRYLVKTGGAHYSLTSTILKCDEYIPLSQLAKLPKED